MTLSFFLKTVLSEQCTVTDPRVASMSARSKHWLDNKSQQPRERAAFTPDSEEKDRQSRKKWSYPTDLRQKDACTPCGYLTPLQPASSLTCFQLSTSLFRFNCQPSQPNTGHCTVTVLHLKIPRFSEHGRCPHLHRRELCSDLLPSTFWLPDPCVLVIMPCATYLATDPGVFVCVFTMHHVAGTKSLMLCRGVFR